MDGLLLRTRLRGINGVVVSIESLWQQTHIGPWKLYQRSQKKSAFVCDWYSAHMCLVNASSSLFESFHGYMYRIIFQCCFEDAHEHARTVGRPLDVDMLLRKMVEKHICTTYNPRHPCS
jgi:hypothetical protein